MSKEDKFSIYSFYQFESIEGKLNKTDVAFERRVRRWYAKELGMSFQKTFELPWTDVISHYYDTQIEETPFNIVYNMAIDEYVPELAEEQERIDQEYADSLVEEQAANLAKKAKKVVKPDVLEPTKKITNFSPELNEKVNKMIDKVEDKPDINMSFDMGNPDDDDDD